ncbi:preprotein translocase subunit SecA [Entomoplasma freundtii]|uniref:Protein translocase subunit SecA n=1 Tax=Entomoplasma freundtii TaxID=74700 RepID=A0A2K8NSD8_9MOLU|nr:preprotein translocase subunit SecA [Entomoplasma freundtii]ATZ16664.1 preprotein translocase subunit SecA [Entomoplasma freundtii]TDY58169.1 preprotein translocase subunit SecA [Entomoplasma freundtii]
MASDSRLIKKYGKIADQIISLDSDMQQLKDEDFVVKTTEFKRRIEKGETVEDLLVEAYALTREAAFRRLGLKAYRVQLIGAIILNAGDIAEMRTGEGKTLVGIFPAYLNALTGKGVHIVTVNEYLSQRDSEINGQVFDLLGITVGLNKSRLSKQGKRFAYAQDVTYTTNAEIGFDYLRDNMVQDPKGKVQRELNYAIIDEADSILIDEARTPLIISGGSTTRVNMYMLADAFVKTLKKPDDVEIDLESKQVFLNESGMQKAKDFFSLDNLFDINNTEIFHLIMNALKANFTFKEGIEYTVKDNEIVLIDQFTGRIMDGRSYSDGLQQALQAKEGVKVEEETMTLATITYQNFYRLYAKLAGMTGTAKTEEEEFIKIYNTRVVVTPTNKPVIRKDETDFVFGTKNAALKRLIEEVRLVHEAGNPILIGTTSVESSEQIAHYLTKAKLHFEMINAKNHAREADIVAKAGQKGAITLSTNMAGRGTDIKLSQEVRDLNGLVVFGVERNEARRIDNQLRGRSGRQGDPGRSRFFISMEDEMMVRFTSPKMRKNFLKLGDDHIKSRLLTRSVTNAQKKLEGLNFDQRKDVLDYDNILAQQREAMYAQRDAILFAQNLKVVIKKFQLTTAFELIVDNSSLVRGEQSIKTKDLLKALDGILVPRGTFKPTDFEGKENMILAQEIADQMMIFYEARIMDVPEDVVLKMERQTILENFDRYWTKHIDVASKLRSGIYLQQYAQNNPLAEYVEQATTLFNKTKVNIAKDVVAKLSQIVIRNVEAQEKPKTITITDKDIMEILSEVGLTKFDLQHEKLKQHFAYLKTQNKDNPDKLRQLQRQFDVLDGLVYELERRQKQTNHQETSPNQGETIELGTKEIKAMAKVFGITNVDEMTLDDINHGYERIKADFPQPEPEMVQQVELARQVLIKLAEELSLLKTIHNEPKTHKENNKSPSSKSNESDEYIIETEMETGEKPRKIRRGQDAEMDMTPSEGTPVKRTRIG